MSLLRHIYAQTRILIPFGYYAISYAEVAHTLSLLVFVCFDGETPQLTKPNNAKKYTAVKWKYGLTNVFV